MKPDSAAHGTIRKTPDGGYEIFFVRRLKKPIEKVWAALTTPERIADWFTDMRFIPEPRLGARVEVRFPDDDPPLEVTDGEVIAFEPPRLFAWTWPDADNVPGSVVRCELESDGDGCILRFSESNRRGTHHLVWGAAGWHAFLDGLEGATEGLSNQGTVQREMALRPHYQAQFDAIMTADGVIRRVGDAYEIVFVRRLSRPIEKVWAALTLPERIADWLAKATIEPDLRVGARFALHFAEGDYRMAGEIVELDPPRLITWTWPDPKGDGITPPSSVRFELEPAGDGCILRLSNGGLVRPDLESVAAGWHTHLEGLERAADSVFTAWSPVREKVHIERYKAAVERLSA